MACVIHGSHPKCFAHRVCKVGLALVLLAVTGMIFNEAAVAQPDIASESQIKAAFLYKFCHYVEWPDGTFPSGTSPLRLGVVGSRGNFEELQKIADGLTVNGRTVEVHFVESFSAVNGIHLLFLARNQRFRTNDFLEFTDGLPIVTVTESPAGFRAGSVINFVVEQERVRFDINLIAAHEHGLRLSAQLLKVARQVKKGSQP